MSCEGWLTFVDKTLGYCELDKKRIIYLSLLKLHNNDFKLPTVPTRVKITKGLSPIQNFFICTEESVIEGKFETSFETTVFINLLQNNKEYAIEVLKLACKATRMLTEDFNIKDEKLKRRLILEILEKLLAIENKPNMKLLKSVHECKSIKLFSTNYSNFPSWSFGIQSCKNILFGFSRVCPLLGCLLLQDYHYKFRIIIPNTCFKDISILDQTYVILKHYKTFSEIFSNAKIPNLEYLYVNLEDIMVLVSTKQGTGCLGLTNVFQPFKNVFKFTLKRKSSVWIGSSLAPEFYLEALVTNANQDVSTETIFLTVPADYVPILIHLKEDNAYALHYNQLRLVKNPELEYIANYKNFLLLDKHSYFQHLPVTVEKTFNQNVMTVQQCKEALSSRTDLISFQGIISKKNFTKNLSSRTQKRPTDLYGFGTTGPDIHQLIFKFKNSDGSSKYLDCYLTNLENLLNPIGLIPQMRVLVKNVLPQSKRYVKSIAFTSFEIICYEPNVDFDTPILNGEIEELSWVKPFFLGLGEHLPHNVMVWGKVTNFYITKINMKHSCKACKIINDAPSPCSQCECTERDMDFFLIMHASDQYAEVRIIAKDPIILKYVLNMPQNQFDSWLQDFCQLGSFNFNIFEPVRYDFDSNEGYFKCLLTDLLLGINKTAIRELEIKCRHFDSDPRKSGGRPLFYYLDSRMNTL